VFIIALVMARQLAALVIQLGGGLVRTLAVGTAFQLHLQQTQVETQLKLRFAVVPADQPDIDLSGLEGPAMEGVSDIHFVEEAAFELAFAFHSDLLTVSQQTRFHRVVLSKAGAL
jgi:hypothetical protein